MNKAQKPHVSLIIPSYNSSKFISETLKSISKQSFKNWECIIVDDGSTDDTIDIIAEICKEDARFIFIQRTRLPNGANTCRNIGLENARGQYIMFMDSDDVLLKNCFEDRINIAEKEKDYDAWVFNTGIFYNKIGDEDKTISPKSQDLKELLYDFIKHDVPWSIMGSFWKRAAIIELKGFNEKYRRLQDVELHTRALLKGLSFFICTESKPDNYYRVSKNEKIKIEYIKEVAIEACVYYIKDVIAYSKDRLDFGVILKHLHRCYFVFYKKFVLPFPEKSKLSYFYALSQNKNFSLKYKTRFSYTMYFLLDKLKLSEFVGFRRLSWEFYKVLNKI